MNGLLPPVNPCGYQVDRLRSCYDADVRFFTDSDETIRIRWYFTDAPQLPVPSAFCSANWTAENGEWVDVLGEVSPGPRPYANGRRPVQAAVLGPRHYCGTADQWANGCSLADAHFANAFGQDPCCSPAPPLALNLILSALLVGGGPPVPMGEELYTLEATFSAGYSQTFSLPVVTTPAAAAEGAAVLTASLGARSNPQADTHEPGVVTGDLLALAGFRGIARVTAASPAHLSALPALIGMGRSSGQVPALLASRGTLASVMATSRRPPSKADLYYRQWQGGTPMAALTDPNTYTWSWVNQGSATLYTGPGFVGIRDTPHSGLNGRQLLTPLPAAPYTVTAALIGSMFGQNSQIWGLALQQAASTKAFYWCQQPGGSAQMFAALFNSPTSQNSAIGSPGVNGDPTPPLWWRIVNDGTNLKFQFSYDGEQWIQYGTTPATSFTTPDHAGLILDTNTASSGLPDTTLCCISFTITTP